MGGRYFQTSVPGHSQCVYTRAREGTVSSFLILGKVSEGCAWNNNNNEAAGREEPRDPRSPETLVVTLGTGECDRVPLGKASGAWSAGHRRDRTQFPVPKNVCVHSHPRTQEPALRNTRHAADTHACSLQPCSHRCFSHSLTQLTHSLTLLPLSAASSPLPSPPTSCPPPSCFFPPLLLPSSPPPPPPSFPRSPPPFSPLFPSTLPFPYPPVIHPHSLTHSLHSRVVIDVDVDADGLTRRP